jgi:hypothetical protein
MLYINKFLNGITDISNIGKKKISKTKVKCKDEA